MVVYLHLLKAFGFLLKAIGFLIFVILMFPFAKLFPDLAVGMFNYTQQLKAEMEAINAETARLKRIEDRKE